MYIRKHKSLTLPRACSCGLRVRVTVMFKSPSAACSSPGPRHSAGEGTTRDIAHRRLHIFCSYTVAVFHRPRASAPSRRSPRKPSPPHLGHGTTPPWHEIIASKRPQVETRLRDPFQYHPLQMLLPHPSHTSSSPVHIHSPGGVVRLYLLCTLDSKLVAKRNRPEVSPCFRA